MKYWIFQNNQVVGPYDQDQIAKLSGVSAETLVCPEGRKGTEMGDWVRAGVVPELAETLLKASRMTAVGGGPNELLPPEPTLKDLAVLGSLQEKTALLESHLSQLQAKFNDELQSHETELSRLKGEVGQKEQVAEDLARKLADVETRLASLASLSSLREDLDHAKRSLSHQERQIEELKEQLARAQAAAPPLPSAGTAAPPLPSAGTAAPPAVEAVEPGIELPPSVFNAPASTVEPPLPSAGTAAPPPAPEPAVTTPPMPEPAVETPSISDLPGVPDSAAAVELPVLPAASAEPLAEPPAPVTTSEKDAPAGELIRLEPKKEASPEPTQPVVPLSSDQPTDLNATMRMEAPKAAPPRPEAPAAVKLEIVALVETTLPKPEPVKPEPVSAKTESTPEATIRIAPALVRPPEVKLEAPMQAARVDVPSGMGRIGMLEASGEAGPAYAISPAAELKATAELKAKAAAQVQSALVSSRPASGDKKGLIMGLVAAFALALGGGAYFMTRTPASKAPVAAAPAAPAVPAAPAASQPAPVPPAEPDPVQAAIDFTKSFVISGTQSSLGQRLEATFPPSGQLDPWMADKIPDQSGKFEVRFYVHKETAYKKSGGKLAKVLEFQFGVTPKSKTVEGMNSQAAAVLKGVDPLEAVLGGESASPSKKKPVRAKRKARGKKAAADAAPAPEAAAKPAEESIEDLLLPGVPKPEAGGRASKKKKKAPATPEP